MSFGINVNILLYASDERSPLHGKSVDFLHPACGRSRIPRFLIFGLVRLSRLM